MRVYESVKQGDGDHLHFHEVSLLFFVLACGVVLERYQNSEGFEAQGLHLRYYHIGKAAFSIEPLGTRNTVWTVASLIMHSHYSVSADWESSAYRWFILGLAIQVSHSVSILYSRSLREHADMFGQIGLRKPFKRPLHLLANMAQTRAQKEMHRSGGWTRRYVSAVGPYTFRYSYATYSL